MLQSVILVYGERAKENGMKRRAWNLALYPFMQEVLRMCVCVCGEFKVVGKVDRMCRESDRWNGLRMRCFDQMFTLSNWKERNTLDTFCCFGGLLRKCGNVLRFMQ